jgi:hypothetical protein
MNTTLTTFDGYPRADIDVAQSKPSQKAKMSTWFNGRQYASHGRGSFICATITKRS